MGFTLYTMGKGMEAVPFLEKIIQSNDSKYETYELLGSIYDDNKQTDKAIDYYKKGIAENPQYERLHFNIGISYLRNKQYDLAEAEEITAIKLNPKHASAQRIYAMAEYDKGNYTHSLLIWCSFLLLEPQTQRSVEAFNYIKAIINRGVTKKDDQHININISTNELGTEEMMTRVGIVAATEDKEFESKKESAVDSLTVELKAVFEGTAERNEKDTTFYAKYFAKYFGALAGSGNMPAFCHLVSLMAYRDENVAWFKENKKQLNDLDSWVQTTSRGF
jgi:tetratricopeptide (TPR) repeat protein